MNIYTVIIALGATTMVSGAATSTNAEGCPTEPTPITCDDGQKSNYIPQTSTQCAHYSCPAAQADNSDANSGSSKAKSVVLPAVLGTLIPLVAIGVGVYLILHYRRRSRRAAEAKHQDAKYMASYNNLDEGSVRSPDVFSSTYSATKWRDSVFNDGSRASIPIIYAEDSRETKLYGAEESAAYRETRLYNTSEAPKATIVPQVPQMPQMVVLGASGPPSLAIDTVGLRATANDTLSPETPDSPGITQLSSPVTTQLPRIVQVGKPQIIRTLAEDQPAPGSPLRVADNGWGSDADSDIGDSFAKDVMQAIDKST
ncbi:hypothetical protein IW139_005867 [Coemansia sp. RSA 353]|nr:hypothetical protein LPJ69_001791 [Coemansia sp. RSA 1752]KAJ1791667.1 hypothetical protein LPJ67_001786 [Coemansia sp. RSA 1938]KAJ1792493.1 hypothetical protein LPJ62_000810 [Coemansia sp. RSA 2167]KAJ2141449.1 hypothetical protein IW142_004847 [Coemansia sp. RSA 564]KAJ2153520.1 hypothetical protein GGH15_005947 [Coemansia sp. RSA 562]KAJ2154233.1 hypothetical protein J3F82_001371 [Coemansia sp. RSA 637]KAJ2186228.1 hypothetical protein GGH18_004204 [Coemansia sp. RSA 530]KAJ2190950.1 